MPGKTMLKSMLAKVSQVMLETERRLARTGEDFSPFSENLIYMGETGVSAILAMLLSPERSHSQGARFLDAFLSALPGCPVSTPVDASRVRVSTERFTWENGSRRYIDIVVESPDFVLAVENKIGAADQSRQLADYLRWLKNTSCGRDFFLAYLTPDGRLPSECSLPADAAREFRGHWTCLPWMDAVEALERDARDTPPRVSVFVGDFCDALRAAIGNAGTKGGDMDEKIVETLASETTKEELMAAAKVFNNYNAAAEKIINDWSLRLAEEIGRRGIKGGRLERSLVPNDDKGETSIVEISYDGQKLNVGVYSGSAHNWELCWGMWARAWEFGHDYDTCMAWPPIRAAMAEFGASSLPGNSIVRATCGRMQLGDPCLLDMLRQPGRPFLADELYDLCMAVEHLGNVS